MSPTRAAGGIRPRDRPARRAPPRSSRHGCRAGGRRHALGDLGVGEREVAGGDVAALLRLERGLLGAADLLRLPAARVEAARRRRVGRRRHVAGEQLALLASPRAPGRRPARPTSARPCTACAGARRAARRSASSTILPRYMTATRSHMWRTTERSWAMKISVSPRSRCRSRSRLRICAWIDTSSAETGSSATISFGLQRERARDADALALAAGELVRIAVVVLRVEPDPVHQVLHRALALALALVHAVDRERLADDRADRAPRVQRRVRVLEDHLHLAPQRLDVARAESPRSRGRRSATEPDVGSSRRSSSRAVVDLPQPLSPDDAERLAAHARRTRRRRRRAPRRAAADEVAALDRELLDEVADLRSALAAGAGAAADPAWSSRRRSFAASPIGTAARARSGSSPAARRCHSSLRVCAGSRQATSWSASPSTGSSFGSTRLCASRTNGQRGWNEQPDGRLISDGGRPSIGTSSSSRGESRRGIERSRPHV